MLSLSPSLLESYRLYRDGDWMSTDDLVKKIKGDFKPTPEIMLGWAYHHMIENFTSTHAMYLATGNPSDEEMLVTSDGFTFAYEPCIAPVLDFIAGGCVYEVYGKKTLETHYGEVRIATKADAVWGNLGGEWKTTQKAIQLQRYMDSVQWKLCCWALGLSCMDYRIVRLEAREDGVWTVNASESIQCYWNNSYLPELMELITGLIEFHQSQGLEHYLIPYYERPENRDVGDISIHNGEAK